MVLHQSLISVVLEKRNLLRMQRLTLFLCIILVTTVQAIPISPSHLAKTKKNKPKVVLTAPVSSDKIICLVDIDDDVRLAHQRYLDAINVSNQSVHFETNTAVSLVIADDQNIFIYTKKDINFDVIKGLFDEEIISKGECTVTRGNSGGLKAFIFKANIIEKGSTDRPFEFIYPQVETRSIYKNKLTNLLGKYLFITRRTDSKLELDEVSRTIVHEALHLFGQDQLILMEPEFDNEISSRYYLDNLSKINLPFKDAINNQVCYSYDILKLKFENKNLAYKRKASALLLSKIIKINKYKKINYGVADIESYWYLVEGIPEYFDHQILARHAPERLLDMYRISCEQNDNNLDYFYPNLIGAAIFHSYEMLGKPIKTELNLLSEFKDIKSWSYRLDSYMVKDNKIKKLRPISFKKYKKIRR